MHHLRAKTRADKVPVSLRLVARPALGDVALVGKSLLFVQNGSRWRIGGRRVTGGNRQIAQVGSRGRRVAGPLVDGLGIVHLGRRGEREFHFSKRHMP